MTSLVLLALVGSASLQPSDDPFAYVGPVSKYLSERATVAPPVVGRPFAIPIDAAGKVPSEAKQPLKMPSWKGEASMVFTGLAYANGTLTGNFQIANASEMVLEGIRVDIAGAVEQYKAKDDQGKEVVRMRPQSTPNDGPWMTADLQPKQSSQVQSFKVTGIKLNPETVDVQVTGLVSGMALIRTMDPEPGADLFALDFDGRGRLYATSNSSGAIYRMNPDGTGKATFATLPAGSTAIAVNRATGEVVAHSWNADRLFRFSSTGQDLEGLMSTGEVPGLDGWAWSARFGKDGTMLVVFGGTLAKMAGSKPAFVLEGVGPYKFEDALQYDIGAAGDIWIGTENTVYRVPANGQGGTRPIIGPSLKLGNVAGIHALRCDASGNVYVAERMGSDHYPRISVFDAQGKFVRVLGRGADKPLGDEEGFHTGQIHTKVRSMAFGPDGRLYMTHEHLDQPILVFEPF